MQLHDTAASNYTQCPQKPMLLSQQSIFNQKTEAKTLITYIIQCGFI